MNACDNATSFDKGFGEAAAPRDAEITALRSALAETQKRLGLAEAVIEALGGTLCIPVYKGRECFFGGYSGFELGHASAESIDKLNAAYAAWAVNKVNP